MAVGSPCPMLVDLTLICIFRSHVLADLRPYVCTYPQCDLAMWTYPSKSTFRRHKKSTHNMSSGGARNIDRTCVFCGEQIESQLRRFHHLCRHMEEIAFTVVTKPYEDWSFYSDSCSGSSGKTPKTRDPCSE